MIKSTHPDFEVLVDGQSVPENADLLGFLAEIGLAHEVKKGTVSLTEQLEFLDSSLYQDIVTRLPAETCENLAVEIHRVIGSTNDLVMDRLSSPDCSLILCTAEMQTAGRGRRGRQWVSPFGRNIYLTIGRFVGRDIAGLGGLSQVVGIQVVDALRSAGVDNVGLKWPNDILLDGGKLGGILVELKPAERRGIGIAVGVGINLLLQEQDTASIDQPWRAVGPERVSRRALLVDISTRILAALERFNHEGFGPFASMWDNYNLYQGQEITIIRGNETFTGTDNGVDVEGNLRLLTDDGEQLHHSGEVSMRPVNAP